MADVSRPTRQSIAANSVSDRQPIPLAPTPVRNAISSAKDVREKLCYYFNNTGSVPWQK